jgi:hypothetical protein
MIETYKHQDGEVLGAKKVGEGSGENEGKIRDPRATKNSPQKKPLFLNRIIVGTD